MVDLNDPTAVALLASRALQSRGIEVAVCGGLALAAYGEPRETKDADFAVCGVSASTARDALLISHLDVIVAFDRVRFGGLFVSRVTLLGGAMARGINMIDLVEPRSARYSREALARAIRGILRGEEIVVLSPEDFVIFKVLATRERDLEDAATVVEGLGASLDLALIERETHLLAQEIPDHDIERRLAKALSRF
ncbi:MAG: nucleotidyl transferase AbiEii/AbiGii toxin family protein [Candidatus Schekmanbacteria bacterium]|nr:nucleotidyl transferase AbiEii/AbiGii toxin family protein [Candidatus Schekmanbacteria bacterium]